MFCSLVVSILLAGQAPGAVVQRYPGTGASIYRDSAGVEVYRDHRGIEYVYDPAMAVRPARFSRPGRPTVPAVNSGDDDRPTVPAPKVRRPEMPPPVPSVPPGGRIVLPAGWTLREESGGPDGQRAWIVVPAP